MSEFGDKRMLLALGAAAGAVASMWLPWFRSGESIRNSFAAFRAAQILGIEWITPLRVGWFLIPVVLLLAAGLWPAGFRPVTSVLLIVVGLTLALGGALFLSIAGIEVGSAAATIAGCCTIIFAGLALRGRKHRA